jgi:uncharacterized protein (TIGR03437 family)
MRIVRSLLPVLILGLVTLAVAGAQTISAVSGNGQIVCQLCFSASPKTTYDPLVVRVLDAAGRPLPSATVTWQITAATGQAGSLSSSSTVTDATGQTSVQFTAAFDLINLFNIPFQQTTITAAIGASSVQFIETQALTNQLQPGVPQVTVNFPVGQLITGQSGAVSSTPLTVTVAASNGTPVAGAAVQLGTDDVAGGPTAACQSGPGQASGVVLTDATGTANCLLVFGPVVGVSGTFKVIVGGGYSVSAAQNFTVTVGPPGLIRIVRGDQQAATVSGVNLPAPLVALVGDLGGNPVGGASVTWSVIPPTAATLFNTRLTSAVDGLVSTNVTIGAASGPFQVRVALSTNPSAGATFTVTAPQVTISGLNKISGDGQSAAQNTAFSALIVQALASGQPAAGVPVGFTVTSGSATPTSGSATTNAQGQASFSLTAGPTVGPVTVVASAGGQSVTFNLSVQPPGPAFTSDSFYNGASGDRGSISPCSLATIIAGGLAPGIQGSVIAPRLFGPWPYLLAGDSVTIGGKPAPIFAVANAGGQESITLQVPCDVAPAAAPGASVTVTVSGVSKTGNAVLRSASPGIFETPMSDGKSRAVLVRPDGSFVDSANNPARRGEIVRLYATGLGQVSALVATNGVPIPGTDVTVNGSVIVGVNNSGVRVVSARLAPDLIAVYEVAFEIPADAPTGTDIVLSVAINPTDGSATQFSRGSLIPIL